MSDLLKALQCNLKDFFLLFPVSAITEVLCQPHDSGEEGTPTNVTKYTCCNKVMALSSPKQWQLYKLWFTSTEMWFNLTQTEPFYDIIYKSGMIYPKYDVMQHWLEFIPLCPVFENLIYKPAWNKTSSVNVCVRLHLNAKASINFLLFALYYYTFAGTASLICCTSFFVSCLIVDSMSSLCCLKMQSMKVFLPHPLKVKPNLSGATLSSSVKSKNQAHISWSHVVQVLTAVCVCFRT